MGISSKRTLNRPGRPDFIPQLGEAKGPLFRAPQKRLSPRTSRTSTTALCFQPQTCGLGGVSGCSADGAVFYQNTPRTHSTQDKLRKNKTLTLDAQDAPDVVRQSQTNQIYRKYKRGCTAWQNSRPCICLFFSSKPHIIFSIMGVETSVLLSKPN